MKLIESLKALTYQIRPYFNVKRIIGFLLIPIIIFSALYFCVSYVVAEEQNKQADMLLKQFYTRFNASLHVMEIASNMVLQNERTKEVVSVDTVDGLEYFDICNMFIQVRDDSIYINNIYLLTKSGYVYSDLGFFNQESIPSLLNRIGTSVGEIHDPLNASGRYVLNNNHIAPYYIISSEEDNFVLIVTLRMTEFLRIFNSIDIDFCAVFNDNFFISSLLLDSVDEDFDWNDKRAIRSLLGAEINCVYYSEDDYTYLIAVDQHNYRRPLRVILGFFVLYSFIMILFALGYYIIVSIRRTKIIDDMLGALPETDNTGDYFATNYPQIYSYLQKYNLQRLSLAHMRKNEKLRNLIMFDENDKTRKKGLTYLGFPDDAEYCVAGFFLSGNNDVFPDKEDMNMDEYVLMLFRTAMDSYHEFPKTLNYEMCSNNDVVAVVFFSDELRQIWNDVQEICHSITDEYLLQYGIFAKVMISSIFDHSSDISEAFSETVSMIDFLNSVNSSTNFLTSEQLKQDNSIVLNGDYIRQIQILLNTVQIHKYDSVPKMVESILQNHVLSLRRDYSIGKSRIRAVTNILSEGIRTAYIDEDLSNEADAIEQSESVQDILEQCLKTYGYLDQKTRCAENEQSVVDFAKNYINENLSDPNLSVAIICDASNVSAQKLTRLFQETFDMAVAEYVNFHRIQRAKSMLRDDSNKTAQEIGKSVGYYNNDTFTRNFKKIEGVTPSEYRKIFETD